MDNLIIRSSIEKYLDASDEILKLLQNFLTIWKEKGTDIDVIEARRIFAFMTQEDQKRKNPHMENPLLYSRHSWVVGEYALELTQRLINKNFSVDLGVSPKEIGYAGGSHDIAKMLLADNYQYAHEHLAWILLSDNDCQDLASLTQPHYPGEETVLKMIRAKGDFLDIKKDEFCQNRLYPFASDLILLADMSCGHGYDGPLPRMNDIRERYPPTAHLVVGINDSERGEKRVLAIEEKVNQLLS